MSKEDQITRLYHRVHRTISAITPAILYVQYYTFIAVNIFESSYSCTTVSRQLNHPKQCIKRHTLSRIKDYKRVTKYSRTVGCKLTQSRLNTVCQSLEQLDFFRITAIFLGCLQNVFDSLSSAPSKSSSDTALPVVHVVTRLDCWPSSTLLYRVSGQFRLLPLHRQETGQCKLLPKHQLVIE